MYTLYANFNSWPLLIFSQTHHEIIVVCCKAYCNSLNYETEWTNDNSFRNWWLTWIGGGWSKDDEGVGGRGEGGLWVRSHISNFLSEFRCRFSRGSLVLLSFLFYLEGNSPYARIFGSFGEHYYFFFQTTSLAWFYFVFPALPHHFSNGPSLKLWIINNAYVNRDTGSQTCSGYTSDLWCFQVLNSDLQCNCQALGYKRVVENFRNTTVDQRWCYKRETVRVMVQFSSCDKWPYRIF